MQLARGELAGPQPFTAPSSLHSKASKNRDADETRAILYLDLPLCNERTRCEQLEDSNLF